MFKYNFVTIEGNTGAGKTSLTKRLAKEFNYKLILEQFKDNPFLPKSYANRERYSFGNEMNFLIDRFEDYKNRISNFDLYRKPHLSDYIFFKTLLYAKVNLPDKDEFELFERYFNLLFTDLEEPELLIYIHSKVPRLIKNIKKRARDFEQEVNPNYLQACEDVYFDWFKKNKHLRIVVIKADDLDFVENEEDYQHIVKLVSDEYEPGLHFVS